MINILSFLWDIVNKEYSEIGTLVLIILKNSIRQRSLYRFSTASNSCFANRGLVDSLT